MKTGIHPEYVEAHVRLIEGTLPLEEWVALVRVSQPEVRRRRGRLRAWWARVRGRWRAVFGLDSRG